MSLLLLAKYHQHGLYGSDKRANIQELYKTNQSGWEWMGGNQPVQQQQQQRVLACSSNHTITMDPSLTALRNNRVLCEDRQKPLEHLKPSNVTKSTIRVTLMQAGLVLSTYMQDQLKLEYERDDRIDNGEITNAEAIAEAEEWEKGEWTRRWQEFPNKLAVALCKYHAIILVTRFYEFLMERIVAVDITMLDLLTQNTFRGAIRISDGINKKSTDGTVTDNQANSNMYSIGTESFHVLRCANVISYLADYSVYQGIMLYGYYVYVKQLKKEERKKEQQKLEDGGPNKNRKEHELDCDINHDTFDRNYLPLSFSIAKRSSFLLLSRMVSLIFASFGGAVGTIAYPGWGTMLGSSAGDSFAGLCMDGINVNTSAPVVLVTNNKTDSSETSSSI